MMKFFFRALNFLSKKNNFAFNRLLNVKIVVFGTKLVVHN